jgi:ABC-2 type transport system permease protein
VSAGRAYAAFAGLAARQALRDRAATVGRVLLYGILLLFFSRLWEAAYEQPGSAAGGSPADRLWYLAFTEWIIISVPLIHHDIESDVRGGTLAYLLTRPVPYVGAKLAEAAGTLVSRMMILGAAGLLFAWALTGQGPPQGWATAWIIPLGFAAALLCLLVQAAIGLCAFWLQDSLPLYWVWQKSVFILGGLILPLSLYPGWMQRLAHFTPAPAVLYLPAHAGVSGDPSAVLAAAGAIALWAAVAAGVLAWTYARARRALDLGGG